MYQTIVNVSCKELEEKCPGVDIRSLVPDTSFVEYVRDRKKDEVQWVLRGGVHFAQMNQFKMDNNLKTMTVEIKEV